MAAPHKVSFQGSAGELVGRLNLPDGEIKAYALYVHCFTCGKDAFYAARIISTWAERFINSQERSLSVH